MNLLQTFIDLGLKPAYSSKKPTKNEIKKDKVHQKEIEQFLKKLNEFESRAQNRRLIVKKFASVA